MILVTGGTGFVGSEIVRQLTAAGHRVRVLARRPERARTLTAATGCELVRGDGMNPESLRAAMTGVTAVIHLVGIIHETPALTFEQAHAEITAHVLAAAQAAGVKRYLHMSALGTRANAVSRYHRSKWEAEELVRRSGLDWTILRPSVIYGPGDQSFTFLSALLRPPFDFWNFYTLPLFGGGESKVQPLDIETTARAFVRALSNSASVGQTYDLCGSEPVTWREVWLLLAERQGVRAQFDPHSTRFLLRSLLWTSLMGLPAFAAIFSWFGLVTAPLLVILAAIWIALLRVACRWRTFLFYPVSWTLPRLLARLARRCLPRWAQFHEQLFLLQEDNVGDPRPAQRDLHLTIRSLREICKR